MTSVIQALGVLLPVLYLVTALLYGMEFGGPKAPRVMQARGTAALATLALHLGLAAATGIEVGHFPVPDAWAVVSLLALALLLVYLPLERLTGTAATGIFVVGAAFGLQLLASAFGARAPEPLRGELVRSPFFVVHVATAIGAVASLLLSGFYGWLYLLLYRQIRERRFGVLYTRLPDLEKLSKLNRGAAGAGFLLLTAGLNLGIWWAHSGAVQDFRYSDPKVLPVLLLWLVFGVIGISRWVRLFSGRRAAWVAVAAASVLLLSVVVSFLPMGSFHVFD